MEARERPVIGFLTDFGLDGAAATCRGVILSICREAQIVDISHTVRKYAIRDGAFVLRAALPYLPVGVHVGVVDPGVGTDRRPIAIAAARGDILVGPDNGLLVEPAEALGGIREARELANRDLWLPATSSTFHGRDIFAPVAAHLAAGSGTYEAVGPALPVDGLVRLPELTATATDHRIDTVVTYVDSFGNLRLAGGAGELRAAFGNLADGRPVRVELDPDGPAVAQPAMFARSFGRVRRGTVLLYVDSSGNLALAENQGNLAERLGATPGRPLRITPP